MSRVLQTRRKSPKGAWGSDKSEALEVAELKVKHDLKDIDMDQVIARLPKAKVKANIQDKVPDPELFIEKN